MVRKNFMDTAIDKLSNVGVHSFSFGAKLGKKVNARKRIGRASTKTAKFIRKKF